MKKMFSLLWTCAVCAATLICAADSLAQSGGGMAANLEFLSQEDRIVRASPEAAAMTRYADYPVSYALGQAEIGIPLMTVEGHSLTLPLTLSYNSSGIRVDEISGTVGLGWTFQAGGVITREVVGRPDEATTDFIVPKVQAGGNVTPLLHLANGFDTDYDRYSYSFCGHAGSFYLLPNGTGGKEIVPTEVTDLWIEQNPTGGFVITDPAGTRYYFTLAETSGRVMGSDDPNAPDVNGTGGGNYDIFTVTAWHLTRIESMDGTDTITIGYRQLSQLTNIRHSDYRSLSYPYWYMSNGEHVSYDDGRADPTPPIQTQEWSYTTTSNWTPFVPDSISYNGGSVLLSYTVNSFRGGFSTSYRSYPMLLDGIVQKDADGHVIRSWELTHLGTGDHRTLLDSVVLKDTDGALTESWKMEYIEPQANMTERAVDLFGYYNGAANGRKTFLRPFHHEGIVPFSVANRQYNATYAQYLSLRSLKTASGSKTVFYYEPNSIAAGNYSDIFPSTIEIGQRIRKITTYDLSDGGTGALVRQRDFAYDNAGITIPAYAFRSGAFMSVSETNTPTEETVVGNWYGWQSPVRVWTLTYSDQSNLPGASLESARIFYGRVTERISSPGEGTVRTDWEYDVSRAVCPGGGTVWLPIDSHDNEHTPYPSSSNHFHQRVPTFIPTLHEDSVPLVPLGYHFDETNTPGLQHPVRVTRYRNTGGAAEEPVSRTEYHYSTGERRIQTGMHVMDRVSHCTAYGYEQNGVWCVEDFDQQQVDRRIVYMRLVRTTETEWLDDGVSTRTVETSYVYDKGSRTAASVNYPLPPATSSSTPEPVPPMGSILSPRLVTQVFDGDPDRVYSRYSIFPDELAAADSAAGTNAYVWASQLLNLGYRQAVGEEILVGGGGLHGNGHVAMIGVPASKSGRYVTWSSFTPADTNTGSLLKPSKVEVWRQEAGDPAGYVNVGPTVQYTRYDHWGNPLEVQQQGQPTKTYLWGYGGLRPVAEIVPIGYAQTRSIIGPSNVDAIASAGNGPTDAQFTQIRSSLATAYSSAQVSLYTYDLSFGISSVEDPSGRKTIYGYDGAGRLTAVKDEDGNLMEGYLYELTRGGNGTPNRIVSLSYTESGTLSAPSSFNATMGASNAMKEVVYLDGLGRTKQGVSVGAATDGQDLVTPSVPDFLDREDARAYLPYPAATSTSNAGSFRPGALAAQQSYYDGLYGSPAEPTVRPYSENVYELSSRNRLTATSLPGFAEQTVHSMSESPADYLPILSFDPQTQILSASGYYGAGYFTVNRTEGPDGSVTESWTDEFGTPVLERVLLEEASGSGTGQSAPRWAETRYVKDIRGRVLCVIPPAEYARLAGQAANSNGIVASFSAEHCYTYAYDGRDRVVTRHLPDQATESLTYNQADLVLATARMAADSIAVETFSTEYDAFNRPVREKYQYGNGPVVTLSEYAYDAYPSTMGTGSSAQAVPEFSAVSGIAETADKDPRVKGLKTAERVRILPAEESESAMAADADAEYIVRSFHYDRKGNVIQTVESRPDESGASGSTVLRTSTKYGFTGNVLQTRESVQLPPSGGSAPSSEEIILNGTVLYDARMRPVRKTARLVTETGPGIQGELRYIYDDLGRTATLIRGTGAQADTTAYSYTLQGWLSSADGGTYSETLRYQSPSRTATDALPGKAGLITEWTTWQKGLSTNGATTLSDTYAYSYDKAGRLLGSVRYNGSSTTPLSTLTENGISYDDSGNLLSIKRYGESSGTVPVDDLSFSYTGTKRTGYSYDAHGNVTQDPTNGTILEWNILGLPRTISDGTDTARRVYAADGALLAVYEVAEGGVDGDGYLYLGNMVFGQSQTDGLSLESVGWEGGLLLPGTTRTSVLYRITDHLGSIRAVSDAAGRVRQRFDYYPFGTVSGAWSLTGIPGGIDDEEPEVPGEPILDPTDPIIVGPGSMTTPLRSPRDSFEVADPGLEIWIDDDPIPAVPPQSVLRYRFGGKEIAGQKVGASAVLSAPAGTPAAAAGRPYLDFGARLYDPRTAAWLAPDPLSEKYYPVSPYVYCAGNPVNFVDPTGKDIWDKIFGFLVGYITNIIPGSGFVRDWYTPNSSADYNQTLQDVDQAAEVVGDAALAISTVEGTAGVALTATGGGLVLSAVGAPEGAVASSAGAALMAESAELSLTGALFKANSKANQSGGYDRGKGSSSEDRTISFTQGQGKDAVRISVPIPDGYRKIKMRGSRKAPVFTNGKDFITPDLDGHNGGIWKRAKSIKDLERRETRRGTYDALLRKIGD